MKTKLVILLMIFFAESYAQNLVPNFDFEDTIACPNGAGALMYSSSWQSFSETPDYFNTCAPSCLQPGICYGIPNNWFGSQTAYSGNGYAGIITYSFAIRDVREILGAQLINSLEIEKQYYFSCYVSRAAGIQTRGATNNIGFRFSTVPFDGTHPIPINNFSHHRETVIILDSSGWTKISGSFVADSAYQYIAIGNFYTDVNTDTVDMDPMGQPWNYAYYYVDYVCVTQDSTNCNPINTVNSSLNNDHFEIYPNPFIEKLKVKSNSLEECSIIIYDVFQRKILERNFLYECVLQTEELRKGMYFYTISNKDVKFKTGKIIKEN